MHKNRKKKIAIFFGIPILTLLVVMLTPLSGPLFKFAQYIANKKEAIQAFQPYIIALIILLSCASAWACHGIAKKKKKNAVTWAKYGFFFNVWAVAWLYFMEEKDEI